jgi:hypothetical protein
VTRPIHARDTSPDKAMTSITSSAAPSTTADSSAGSTLEVPGRSAARRYSPAARPATTHATHTPIEAPTYLAV